MKAVRMWNKRFCYDFGVSVKKYCSVVPGEQPLVTYHWNTEGQSIENEGGEKHNDENDPERC